MITKQAPKHNRSRAEFLPEKQNLNCIVAEKLSGSKRYDFICNFTDGLIACVDLYGVKQRIQVDSCDASVDNIGSADSAGDIGG